MRKIAVDQLQAGMQVAKSIYKADGMPLLRAGTLLTDGYIRRLMDLGISAVYIYDEYTADLDITDVICESTRVEAVAKLRKVMDAARLGQGINLNIVRETKEIVNKIIDDLLVNKDILVNLNDIRVVDDYTFGHSVNVSVLSLIVGIAMGYNQLQLRDLGVGALLHDVGKTQINEKILKKPTSLQAEEFEEIKKHTWYGYEILRNCDNISLLSSHIALQHHEGYNGNGYPRNLHGTEIHEYARIVSVVDIYDALTSDRVYRKAILPYYAIELLQTLKGDKLDPQIVDLFLRHIPPYPLGSKVKLSTGEFGFVIDLNKNSITRPVVRIFQDTKKGIYHEIDLVKHPSVFIMEVLS